MKSSTPMLGCNTRGNSMYYAIHCAHRLTCGYTLTPKKYKLPITCILPAPSSTILEILRTFIRRPNALLVEINLDILWHPIIIKNTEPVARRRARPSANHTLSGSSTSHHTHGLPRTTTPDPVWPAIGRNNGPEARVYRLPHGVGPWRLSLTANDDLAISP